MYQWKTNMFISTTHPTTTTITIVIPAPRILPTPPLPRISMDISCGGGTVIVCTQLPPPPPQLAPPYTQWKQWGMISPNI